MHYPHVVNFTVLVTSALWTSLAFGQVQKSQPASRGFQVDEILVTAQRRTERLQDVPLSITAHTGDTLRESGVTNIRDLSIIVPGLSFTTQGIFAEPSIRGVQTTISQAGGDSPIAIYLDGFYQPNQMGNVFDLPDVERIEVLKGPQGTLFGRNATGGAIVIHTLKPSYETTGKISISDGLYLGSNAKTSNEFRASAYLSGALVEDKLALGVSGYYSHTDGYLTNNVTGGRAGRIETYTTRGKLLFEPTSNISFLLTGLYSKREDEAGASLFPLAGASAAQAFPDAILPTEPWHIASELRAGDPAGTSHRAVTLRSQFDLERWGTLTSLTGYTVVKASTTSDTDAAYSPTCLQAFSCIIFDLGYGPNKTFQQEFSFASEQFGDFNFVAGAFIYHDRHNLTADINPPIVNGEVAGQGLFFSDSRIKTEAYAGFGELNWHATDRLMLIGGLRYSWEEKSGTGTILGGPALNLGSPSWSSWTPRFSARFDLSDQANVYATFSKGFKSGVMDSVGVTTNIADPEKLTSYEVGAKINTGRLTLNAATFYYDYKDLQVQFFDGSRLLMANAADAEIYGFEFDGSFHVTQEFLIRGGASWVPHAKYESFVGGVDFALLPNNTLTQTVVDASGFRLLKAPRFTGNLAGQFTTDLGGGELQADVNLYYSSKMNWNLLGRVQTDNYITVNSRISYTPAASAFQFSLWGKNILNEDYITGTIMSASSDGVVFAPPRQVGITVDYNF